MITGIKKIFTNILFTSIFFIGITAVLCYMYLLISSNEVESIIFSSQRERLEKKRIPRAALIVHRRGLRKENRTVADALAQNVRVLCWIMTCPENHEKKAKHVKETWGKRCHILLFMSTKKDDFLPTVKLDVLEGRRYLWGKTKKAFKYIYDHYRDEADWFLKADDDTYVVMENLQEMLSQYNTDSIVYFGDFHIPIVKDLNGYMDGGSGYVLSRATLDVFVKRGLRPDTGCKQQDIGIEDVEMGNCLHKLNVEMVPTWEPLNETYPFPRNRFFKYPPLMSTWNDSSINRGPNILWDAYKTKYQNSTISFKCCSNFTISFHYVTPEKMHELDYFIYSLRPYGIAYKFNNKKIISEKTNSYLIW